MEIIKTERLVLRTLEESDWDGLCKILQDEEVMYAYEGAFDAQEVRNWLEKQWTRYREDGFGLWCVVHIPADTRSAFPVISVHSQVSIQCRWQS